MSKEQKIKKGHVYVGTTDGGIFPFSTLRDSEIKKSSKQVKPVSTRWVKQHGLVSQPYSTESLLTLYESNPVLFACVNQVAKDVAGTGWNISLKEGATENKIDLERINNFIAHPNEDDSFRTILKELIIDWGSVGWFGFEVVRNNVGEIVEVYRVPAHTLYVHKSKKKFCQIRQRKKVWFKKFGIEEHYSAKTGEEGEYGEEDRANELLYYRNFYSKSDFYGIPNLISSTGDVIGLIGVRDYNLNFFENYGVPASIIVLEGDWDEGAEEKISNFIDTEIKGTDNAHRTLVVTQPDNCKFTYEPLVTEVKDSSFRLYQQQLKENILVAYSMPPERIGIRVVGKLGGNVAEEATKIYIQGVVEPLQSDLESIINDKLLQSESYEFSFNNIDFRDYDSLVKQLGYEIEHGMKTPNEARNELGLKPYPEGDKFYIMSGLIEVGEAEDENKLSKEEEELIEEEEVIDD